MQRVQNILAIFVLCLLAAEVEGRAAPRRTGRSRARLDAHVTQALQQNDSQPQRVIIRARPGSESTVSQALRAHGDRVYARHVSIDGFAAEIHGEDLAALVESDLIESISVDARVRSHGLIGGLLGVVGGVLGAVLDPGDIDTSQPPVSPKVLRETLGLSTTSWTGRGIGVAVIDSGIAPTADFQSRIAAFYDFTNGGLVAKTAFDDYGHGTHVAGTIGGSGALSTDSKYRGLAPKVRLIGLKVLDAQGQGWTSDVLRAIDFAVANKTTLGIDIINLSLGHPIFEPAASDPLVQAVERAVRAGIVVVASAGNMGKNHETGLPGYAGITSPGNAPSAITAGSVNVFNSVGRDDDRIATYSSRGPTWYNGTVKPDVVAPGHDLVGAASRTGTLYKNYPQLRAPDDSDYMRLSGTSMAAAVTSGVVALMLEANRYTNSYPNRPSLTPNAVKAALEYTALNIHDQHGVEYDLLTKGTGSLNGRGAVQVARALDTSQPQGAPWVIQSLAPAYPWTTINGQSLPWSQSLIWGNTVIWGSTIQLNHPAWSATVIWGSNDTVIWGSNDTVIWGSNDTVIWGSNDTVIWGSSDTVIWGSNDTVIWGSNDTVIWGSNDMVWQNPSTWSTAVVWGNDSLGVVQGGTVIWGSTNGLTQDTVIWGSLEEKVENTAASQGTLVLPK